MAAINTINPLDLIYPQEQCQRDVINWPTTDIFEKNLVALSERDSYLAGLLRDFVMPGNYKLGYGSDGSVCYRVVNSQGHGIWLGKRSAPRLAAESDLMRLDANGSSMAINGFGDGYTVQALLARSVAFQAFFVLEKDLAVIKANLQIHELSQYIHAGQLVIIHGERPFNKLIDFLGVNPGYQLIEKALYCHHISEQENNQFNQSTSAAVETALQQIVRINQELNEQLGSFTGRCIAGSEPESLTVSNIPCGNIPVDTNLSRDIIEGFVGLGLKGHVNAYDRPDNATLIAQNRSLLEQKPDFVVSVNMLRKMSKHPLNERLPLVSILPTLTEKLTDELSKDVAGSRDIVVCPASCIEHFADKGLLQRTISFSHLVNTDRYRPISQEEYGILAAKSPVPPISPILMISDRYPLNPEDYNVVLNSYQNLLTSACQAVADDPAGYNSSLESMYFDKARKRSQAKIADDEIKETMQCIFSQMAESVCQDVYGQALLRNSLPVSAFHFSGGHITGLRLYDDPEQDQPAWKDSTLIGSLLGSVSDGEYLNLLFNCAGLVIFTSARGKVTQLMLQAVAAGCLVLTKAHPQDNRPEGLSGVFQPGKEVVTYTNSQDLCRKVEFYLNNPGKVSEITAAARHKVEREFSHKCLCGEILEKLRAE